MVLNSKIVVKPSKIAGLGLYATAPIAKGEMVSRERLRESLYCTICRYFHGLLAPLGPCRAI
jgi:SET domain-containing protein